MEEVYKRVDRFEEKPLPITVSNARKALPSTSFNKFLEITGYKIHGHSPKGERRIAIEAMFINDKIAVEKLHSDYSLVDRVNKAMTERLYLIETKHI